MYQIDQYEDTIHFYDDDKNDTSSTPEYTQIPLQEQHEPQFVLPYGIDPSVKNSVPASDIQNYSVPRK